MYYFQDFVEMFAQVLFNGNIDMAGIVILFAVFIIIGFIFSSISANLQYLLPIYFALTILFGALNIVSLDITVILCIVIAVLGAITIRNVTQGRSA